jgi:hypothetical protein
MCVCKVIVKLARDRERQGKRKRTIFVFQQVQLCLYVGTSGYSVMP